MMFCGRKECSGCKFFKRDGCVTVPDCAYKDLKEKLDKAIEALRFYANRRNFDFNNEKELRYCNSDDQADVYQSFGQKAQDCLKEIEG